MQGSLVTKVLVLFSNEGLRSPGGAIRVKESRGHELVNSGRNEVTWRRLTSSWDRNNSFVSSNLFFRENKIYNLWLIWERPYSLRLEQLVFLEKLTNWYQNLTSALTKICQMRRPFSHKLIWLPPFLMPLNVAICNYFIYSSCKQTADEIVKWKGCLVISINRKVNFLHCGNKKHQYTTHEWVMCDLKEQQQ